MQAADDNKEMLYPHVSVDCVLLGIDNGQLCVLLVERKNAGTGKTEYKLPGSIIYTEEDLDDAAYRILYEHTGLRRIPLKQFRSFGAPGRASRKEDSAWLERAYKMKIGRLVTVAYLALCKVRKAKPDHRYGAARWTPVKALPHLPFDHREIIEAAVKEIRIWIELEPSIVFSYLPPMFTALQLRQTYELIYDKTIDVRNFHKKMNSLDYVVQTDRMETGVAHRSARYYRFDKVKYNKLRSRLNKS